MDAETSLLGNQATHDAGAWRLQLLSRLGQDAVVEPWEQIQAGIDVTTRLLNG